MSEAFPPKVAPPMDIWPASDGPTNVGATAVAEESPPPQAINRMAANKIMYALAIGLDFTDNNLGFCS